jgi:hypothetical protein
LLRGKVEKVKTKIVAQNKNRLVNYAEMGRIVSEKHNVAIDRRMVRMFVTEQGAPQTGGDCNPEEFLAWYEKAKPDAAAGTMSELSRVKLAIQKQKLKDEKFNGDRERGLYVLKTEAALHEATCAKKFHALVKRIETEPARLAQERLRELGLNDQAIVTATGIMRQAGVEIVTAIELECQKLAERKNE